MGNRVKTTSCSHVEEGYAVILKSTGVSGVERERILILKVVTCMESRLLWETQWPAFITLKKLNFK